MKILRLPGLILLLTAPTLFQACEDMDPACETAYDELYTFNETTGNYYFVRNKLKFTYDGFWWNYYDEIQLNNVCGSSIVDAAYCIRFKKGVDQYRVREYFRMNGNDSDLYPVWKTGGQSKVLIGGDLLVPKKKSPATHYLEVGFSIDGRGKTQASIESIVDELLESMQVVIGYRKIPVSQ